ncbi:MAG: hypothetical protein ACRC3H_22570 [Lachnospiraceae bacterium]
MRIKKYKVVIAQSGKHDIQAMKTLDVFPGAHKPTGFEYRGYIWQFIIKIWLEKSTD